MEPQASAASSDRLSPSQVSSLLDEEVDFSTSHLMAALRTAWASRAETVDVGREELDILREALVNSLPLDVLSPFSADPDRGEKIRRCITRLLADGVVKLPPSPQVVEAVYQRVAGLGPLEGLVRDPAVSEIVVESWDSILVEREGVMFATPLHFGSAEEALEVVQSLVLLMGRRINRANPVASFNLPDGSRMTAVIPPAALRGATLAIRRFRATRFRLTDWVEKGSMSAEMAAYVAQGLQAGLNFLISGTVSTGKTTLLETCLTELRDLVGPGGAVRAVVIIEDTHELHPDYRYVRELVTSEEIGHTMGYLARTALRMRPDVIVVGETRGPEAADMLYAMSAGIATGLTTIHAAAPEGALRRMMVYVQMAGAESPYREVPHLLGDIIGDSIDVVIHLTRLPGGARKVAAIVEVEGYSAQRFALREVFRLEGDRFLQAPDYKPAPRVARKLGDGIVPGAQSPGTIPL